jgi:hypothetical protein
LDHDIELGAFSVAQPTLEDIYLELTDSDATPAAAQPDPEKVPA